MAIRLCLIFVQLVLLAVVAWTDLRQRRVANRWLLLLAVAGTITAWTAGGRLDPGASLVGMAVCGLPFACIYYLSEDMGGADVKFAAVCGWTQGAGRGLGVLLVGLLLVAVVYGSSARWRRIARSRGIPLVTWLAPIYAVAILLCLAEF
ncbi:MAG: prepilin peptidase [Bacillota bacterium]|nr:prepilin peptidase [Bacillota bacterium]